MRPTTAPPIWLARLSRRRPGPRGWVLGLSAGLIAAAAVLVSVNVADHLETTATNQSIRSMTAIIRAYVDPLLDGADLAHPDAARSATINDQLVRLASSGEILRLKIWAPDGTIVYSDLPALRGRQFPVDGDLGEALAGSNAATYSSATDDENVFERGLANRFLSIYLPIQIPGQAGVIGAYEIYQDAAPIEAQVAATRQDVLLIVGGMALGLFGVLALAFAGTSKLLGRQNRQLRERADRERQLSGDLRRSEERFRSLVQNSADIVVVVRADETIAYESPAVERVLGHRVIDRIGRPASELVHPDERTWFRGFLDEVLRSPGREISGQFRTRHADGSWRYVDAVAKNLLDDQAVAGVVMNYRDVSERRALEEELKRQAFHDSLTGLANRALFADRLDHALARARRTAEPSRVSVLFLDLDDFKTVNDSLGHGEGDRLLVGVAERLRSSCRPMDTVARMGGDEFAVLLEDIGDGPDALVAAGRLLAALEAPLEITGRAMLVRASIGAATSSADTILGADLLRDADIAMYSAKRKGKGQVVHYEPSMHEAAVARLALVADLDRALEHGQFFVEYQPIVELASGEIRGAEALVRWRHPVHGVVAPGAFIPMAEETGLIVALDRWVLRSAVGEAASWRRGGARSRATISVNVSGRHLLQRGLVDEVAAVLRETGLEPARLLLEFTESVLIEDTQATAATFERLRALGVRLALDDFGTGYSSLSYLRGIPVDVLKIDGSFVRAAAGPDEDALLRSIVDLGVSLRLQVIAEGIENAGHLERLVGLGAQFGQGFFFWRPLSATAIAALVAPGAGGSCDHHAGVATGSANDGRRRGFPQLGPGQASVTVRSGLPPT